jgi:hypothetical protein
MMMRSVVVRGALFAGGAYALGALTGRRWMDRWGSTAEERALPLAGDELVPDAEQHTHAITIDVPPEAVWPWLVQMGQGRAGFYSHDRLERLVGAAIRNAEKIHPEWQRAERQAAVMLRPDVRMSISSRAMNPRLRPEVGGGHARSRAA